MKKSSTKKSSTKKSSTKKSSTKPPRRKLYVAYLEGEVAGMSSGYTDAEAKRIFANERKVPESAVEVKWTGLKEVSLAEYSAACAKQAEFMQV